MAGGGHLGRPRIVYHTINHAAGRPSQHGVAPWHTPCFLAFTQIAISGTIPPRKVRRPPQKAAAALRFTSNRGKDAEHETVFCRRSVALSVGFVAVATLCAQGPWRHRFADRSRVTGHGVDRPESVRFKQSIDTLKKEYDAKAQALKQEGDTGNQLTEKVRSMPAGSPERKKLEQEVLKMRADFELHGKAPSTTIPANAR